MLIFYFLITFISELFLYLLFFRKNFLQTLFYCFLINLLSWPLAQLFNGLFPACFLVVELCVVFIEFSLIFLLFQTSLRRALLVSFLANLLSACLSFL